jgi:cytochrome c oxidase assembly protein subunit 15
MIGYIQYFSGLPAGLVWVHVCGSTLIWIVALRLMFALRDRGALVTETGQPETPAAPASAEPAAAH